jgi:hypothetical protein
MLGVAFEEGEGGLLEVEGVIEVVGEADRGSGGAGVALEIEQVVQLIGIE